MILALCKAEKAWYNGKQKKPGGNKTVRDAKQNFFLLLVILKRGEIVAGDLRIQAGR